MPITRDSSRPQYNLLCIFFQLIISPPDVCSFMYNVYRILMAPEIVKHTSAPFPSSRSDRATRRRRTACSIANVLLTGPERGPRFSPSCNFNDGGSSEANSWQARTSGISYSRDLSYVFNRQAKLSFLKTAVEQTHTTTSNKQMGICWIDTAQDFGSARKNVTIAFEYAWIKRCEGEPKGQLWYGM